MSNISAFIQKRLRDLRNASGLTQEAYAELCGIPYKVYQHIERGRRNNPRLTTLEKLAKGYGLTVHDLFALETPTIRRKFKQAEPPHYRKLKKTTPKESKRK